MPQLLDKDRPWGSSDVKQPSLNTLVVKWLIEWKLLKQEPWLDRLIKAQDYQLGDNKDR